MIWKNTDARYGSLSIGMHWLMVLLLVGAYATINLHDWAPKGGDLRAAFKTWHFALGLAVLTLVAARLAIRSLAGPAPRIEPVPSAWQRRLAAIAHIALYAFMIGLPLLGWLAVSAKGRPVMLSGLPLPALIGPDKDLAGSLKEIHEIVATAGYYLIGLHALAALIHHYLLRDSTLVRMLPRRKGNQASSGSFPTTRNPPIDAERS